MKDEIAYAQKAAMDGKMIGAGDTAPIDICLYRTAERIEDCDYVMKNKPIGPAEIAAGILPAFEALVKKEKAISTKGKLKYLVDERFFQEEEGVGELDTAVTCDRCNLQVFNYFWVHENEDHSSICTDYCDKCINALTRAKSKRKGKRTVQAQICPPTTQDVGVPCGISAQLYSRR